MNTIFTLKKNTKGLHKPFLIMVLLLSFAQYMFAQQKYIVEASNTIFTPDELTIQAGDTVEWMNVEGYHNVNGTQDAYPMNPESFGNDPGRDWTYSHVFKTMGMYDYHCDPHLSLGMTGKIMVLDSVGYMLTMDFSNMDPHIGQMLYLAVVDKETGMEVARAEKTVSASFDLSVAGLEMNHSYYVNFYADFNDNGMYDAPPTDHAWQMEVDDVMGDTELMFTHNTNFTDIMWINRLTVDFKNMTPHLGQMLYLSVSDQGTGMELDRVMTQVNTADFMVYVYGIEDGMSYNVDFFADHNQNGMYDAPPADHAWRMELNNAMGDDTLTFTHNTNFTDIMWMNKLTVMFMDMTPHIGQNLWLGVIDKTTGEEIASTTKTVEEDFKVELFGIENGESYNVDFYVDFNENNEYDAPPTDHAWRLELNDVMGDDTLMFTHNTNFTDIFMSTGIDQRFLADTKIYPNPAQDQITIEFNKSISSAPQVTVYDLAGRIEYKTVHTSANYIDLNIQKLTKGIYFVEVKTKSDKKVFKLVKE